MVAAVQAVAGLSLRLMIQVLVLLLTLTPELTFLRYLVLVWFEDLHCIPKGNNALRQLFSENLLGVLMLARHANPFFR